MYCKFCGNIIASNTTKCTACGANIDLTDGGQSFFDDNELEAWQSDNYMPKEAQTYMPKTEMREVPDNSFAENDETYLQRPRSSLSSIGSRARVRRKKKKTVLDYLNLSSANKLIIFCIASALVIVLLVVAIIAVISGGDNKNTDSNLNTGSAYTEQQNSRNSNDASLNGAYPKLNEGVEVKNEPANDKKREIKDIVIKKGEIEISGSSLGYEIDGVVYVAIYDILKHEGYKDKIVPADGNPVYDYNENNERKIAVKINADDIWVKSETDKDVPPPQHLSSKTLEIDGVIYVPALSFLEKYGCYKYNYDNKNNILYYEK